MVGVRTRRRCHRAEGVRQPLPSGHEQMKQDRASTLCQAHAQLARPTAHELQDGKRALGWSNDYTYLATVPYVRVEFPRFTGALGTNNGPSLRERRIVKFKTLLLLRLLAAALTGTVAHQAHADVSEANECRVPTEIYFSREYPDYLVRRYVRFPGSNYYTLLSGPNLQAHAGSGPSYGQNCTTGSAGKTVMQMTYKLKTRNVFSTPLVDHIAFGMRGYFFSYDGACPRTAAFGLTNGYPLGYRARGIIFHRAWGIKGELFNNYDTDNTAGCPSIYNDIEKATQPLALYDNVEYAVNIYVSATAVSYRVVQTSNPTNMADRMYSSPGSWTEQKPLPLNANGFAVVLLCNTTSHGTNTCELPAIPPPDPTFSVHIYDLNVTWY